MYLDVSTLGHYWAGGKVRAYTGISERKVGLIMPIYHHPHHLGLPEQAVSKPCTCSLSHFLTFSLSHFLTFSQTQ